MKQAAELPRDKGVELLAEHMQKYYYPDMTVDEIRKILGRGDGGLWKALAPRDKDEEHLTPWIVKNLIDWDLLVRRDPNAGKMGAAQQKQWVESTASWVLAMYRLCRRAGVPMITFVIPAAGQVDARYRRLWRFWPGQTAMSNLRNQLSDRLLDLLHKHGLQACDLRKPLREVEGVYRITDGHWNSKGHQLVAKVVARILGKELE